MKKLSGMLLALLLIVSLATPALAASTQHEIPQFGLTISIPDGYDVFTRDMAENDPLLQDYGLTRDDVLDILGTDTYLDALESQGEDEIVMTLFGDMGMDFGGLGDEALLMLASSFEKSYEASGITVLSTEAYNHPKLNFMRFHLYIPETNTYGVQFYTIYDGIALSVTLRTDSAAVTDAQEKKIQSVVDSISIPSYTPEKPRVEETPAFLYTDPETGTTFTVPENWTERDPSEEREYIDVLFSYAKEPVPQITYGSQNMSWELFSLEREMLDTEAVAEAICDRLADEMGVPRSAVSRTTYHGEAYYLVESPQTSDEYGITVTFTQAMHIEDGWVYLFQATGGKNSRGFEELEKVLESVEYPKSVMTWESAEGGSDSVTDRQTMKLFPWILVCLLGLIIGKLIKSRVERKAERKAIQKKAGTSESVYCRSCGKRFPAGTRVCDVCGEKLK